MKLCLLVSFILIFLLSPLLGASEKLSLQYRDQQRSLILWDQVNTNEWSDFELWKKQLYLKESSPQWELTLRENRLKEAVGKVLQCIGQCLVETGKGSSSARFRSNIYEQEDVVTGDDSYLWVFMMDGSLLRLSPNSSVTLNEIDISVESNFFHLRVNYGNALWLGRSLEKYRDDIGRETDSLFIPLDFYDANEQTIPNDVQENSLVDFLERSVARQSRFPQLNGLIEENNKFAKNKDTYLLMVAPNASIFAKNPTLEFVVLVGAESYIKARVNKQLGLEGTSPLDSLELDYRGFRGETSTTIEVDRWIKVSANGRELGYPSSNMLQQLRIGEFPTRRIPSILIAREMLLSELSPFMYDTQIDRLTLARDHGYRLWAKLPSGDDWELSQRITFLREYVRRLETTNLLASQQVLGKYQAGRDTAFASSYTNKYFNRAILNYLKKGDAIPGGVADFRELNSTRRTLWKKMHAIR